MGVIELVVMLVLMVMVVVVVMTRFLVGVDRSLCRGVPEMGIVARVSAPGGKQ